MAELPTTATVPVTESTPASLAPSDQERYEKRIEFLQRRLDETVEKVYELAACKRRIEALEKEAVILKDRLSRCKESKKKLKIASSKPSDAKRPCANFSSCGIYIHESERRSVCHVCNCD